VSIVTCFILFARKISRIVALYSFPRYGVHRASRRRRTRWPWRNRKALSSSASSIQRKRPQRAHQHPSITNTRASVAMVNTFRDGSNRTTPSAGGGSTHVKPWPQRKDLHVPKRTWARITQGIEKLDALPSWLGPPPAEEMPQTTKDGVMGWDWEYAHRSRRTTDYSNKWDSAEQDEYEHEFNKPIHYTRYVKLAFPLLIYVLGNDKLSNESEREYVERKMLTNSLAPNASASASATNVPSNELLNEMQMRCLTIFEKAKYGHEEIEKREYLLYMNNLNKIISWYRTQRSSMHMRMDSEHDYSGGPSMHFSRFRISRDRARKPSIFSFAGSGL